jgi:branched-chain amino acid transport system ATP-binding protein
LVILEIEALVAGYGSGPDILKGVSLQVEQGRSYCIIGPNGAGKSTLLKVIAGLLPVRQGQIIYRGKRIDSLRTDQILEQGICFVPQDRSLFPDMTVRENLRMGGYILKDGRELARRTDEVLEMFPILKERRSQPAKTLSGGQQQMLAIGRTLILQPETILLDEPSLGLAPQIARQIFDVVGDLKRRGMTVIIVEQNARLGLEAADLGVVLDLGKNGFMAEATTVLSDPRIQELYLGKRSQRSQVTKDPL